MKAKKSTVPRRPVIGSADEWLRRAKSSLALALRGSAEEFIYLEDFCYQAQQAAEKALNSVYVAHRLEMRFTHDIRILMLGLRHQGFEFPAGLERAVLLTQYAVEMRYPHLEEVVSESEFNEAIEAAEHVIAWAETELNRMTP